MVRDKQWMHSFLEERERVGQQCGALPTWMEENSKALFLEVA
jgi:hypothetical protein